MSVGPQNVHRVVHQSHQNGDQSAPSEPPKSARHQLRNHLSFCGTIKSLHQVHIHKVEKIQVSNPDYARQKVQSPEENLNVRFAAFRRVEDTAKEESWL